jgi:peroxiredoxin
MNARAIPTRSSVLVSLAAACLAACRSNASSADYQPAATTAAAPTETGSRTLVPPAAATDVPRVSTGDASADLGSVVPDFELFDAHGRMHRLSSYRGKIVVLEWFDPQSEFVRYAYDQGPLTEMHRRGAAAGIGWLVICSTSPDRAAAVAAAAREFADQRKITSPILIDRDGRVGQSFNARTTPQLFVINNRGALVYSGALDNAPMGRVERAAAKTNYVEAALLDLRSGHAVTISSTRPYGTAISYSKP